MKRIMIKDVDGGEHDFSAGQTVRSMFHEFNSEPSYIIGDHCQSYRVTLAEYDRVEAEEKAAFKSQGMKPEPEDWIESGRTGGVEIGELPSCTAQNYARVLGGAARASEKYFGHDDDPWSAGR
jgi:hypothetical protein